MKQRFILGCLLVISIQIILTKSEYQYDPQACGSITINCQKGFELIKHCERVEGFVEISNFRVEDANNIASNIEEIALYLLIYRLEGLDSLEQIFPKLTIIRGHDLLFDKYALVIYENRELRNVGLKSLIKIRNGHVKIESNPMLCYTKTVNWVYLFEDHMTQHYVLKQNQDDNECPKCVKIKPENDHQFVDKKFFRFNCWDKNNYQRKKTVDRVNGCPAGCDNKGCTYGGECCSELCLSGCLAKNCRICRDYKTFDGKCVTTCNFPYYKLADKCLSEYQCRKIGYIPHAGYCGKECPPSYQKDENNLKCVLNCKGNFVIHCTQDLEYLRDCIVIQGSVHIELKGDQSDDIIQELESALGAVTEIRDYLKVTNSPQIYSLSFFKKLDTIRGENLIDKEIALYVVDNFHMEEIWPENQKVAIFNGRIFFHLNPRLCYEKILVLASSLRNMDKIQVRDASHNSNGERIVCGREIKPLYPIIEEFNATAARVKLKPLASSDRYPVLGYLFYLKEAPIKNVTMFDGRHGCGRDNWIMNIQMGPNIRHVFSKLKPNTQYAYFVKTFTSLTNNYQRQDWYSPIQYFTTKSLKPGPVQKIYSLQIAETAAIIHWWPPKTTNGVIEKYMIRRELTNHHVRFTQIFGYGPDQGDNKDCECNIKQKVRGPPPYDVDFYTREKVIYETAVLNFIYISSKRVKQMKEEEEEEDKTRRKREDLNSTFLEENPLLKNLNINVTDTETLLKKHLAQVELDSILEQDTGADKFPIIQPRPVCATNSTKEKNCDPLECYLGTEVPGTMHSYIMDEFIPDKIYRIFVRACVKGLQNNCGPEKYIEVQTHSKRLKKRHLYYG